MNKSKQVVRVDDNSTKKVKVSRVDTSNLFKIIGGVLGVIAFIAACVVIGYESFHVDPVMTVEGKKYYLSDPEVKFSVYMAEASLLNQGETYGVYYGMDAASFFEANKSSAKADALSSLEETFLMYNEAVKQGETLSDEDKTTTEEDYGKIFDKMSKKRVKRLDMTREEFIEQALKIKLAYQYMNKLVEDYGITKDNLTTPVDKANYDEREFEVIEVPLTTTNSDSETVDVSEKDKAAYLKQMKEYLKEAQKGTELSKILSSDEKTYTYEKKSLLTSDSSNAELMAKIKDMKNKTVYDGVIEADKAYYIVKMTNNKVTTQYDQAVENQISTEQQTKLEEDIASLKETYKLTEEKGWDAVELGTVAVYPTDSLDEFAEDEEESATATPKATATANASATPEASAKASATPEATAKATASPSN
ncbi:MAG: hypothetical protein Q4F05_17835 [bacterium]|nr:hypothetical protein [bacterium]